MAKEREFKLSLLSSLCLFDSIPLQDLPPASPHDPLQQISQAVHEFEALRHDDTFYDDMGWAFETRVTSFGHTPPKNGNAMHFDAVNNLHDFANFLQSYFS
jgi:hypothetical protein